jgi:hypothetical protein
VIDWDKNVEYLVTLLRKRYVKGEEITLLVNVHDTLLAHHWASKDDCLKVRDLLKLMQLVGAKVHLFTSNGKEVTRERLLRQLKRMNFPHEGFVELVEDGVKFNYTMLVDDKAGLPLVLAAFEAFLIEIK